MKRLILSLVVVVLAVGVYGQVMRLGFKDAGIAGLKSIDETYGVNAGLFYVFGRDAENEAFIYKSLTTYVDEYINDTADYPIVVIAQSTGHIMQSLRSFGQEIEVQQVLKGEGIKPSERFFVFNGSGFAVRNSPRPVYMGIKNMMRPDKQYLLFLEDTSLEEYGGPRTYELQGSFFNYLELSQRYSAPITEKLEDISFNDLHDREYFATSQRILDQLDYIKQEIIKLHMGEAALE